MGRCKDQEDGSCSWVVVIEGRLLPGRESMKPQRSSQRCRTGIGDAYFQRWVLEGEERESKKRNEEF
jgi:hypothetical protein